MLHSMMVAAEVVERWQVGLGEERSDGGTRSQKEGAGRPVARGRKMKGALGRGLGGSEADTQSPP